MLQPDPLSFADQARRFDFVPVYRRLLSDTLTPVTAFSKLDDGGPACLFESVVGGEKVGRYSFLVARPLRRFTATRTTVAVEDLVDGTQSVSQHDQPLELFRQSFGHSVAHHVGMPPFVGGAVGYAAYDVIRYVERLPNSPEDDRQLPDIDFSFYHDVCVFDHIDKTVWAITLADCRQVSPDDGGAADDGGDMQQSNEPTSDEITSIYQAASQKVDQMVARLSAADPNSIVCMDIDGDEIGDDVEVTSNLDQSGFESIVRRCVEYIRAGDIFQVVPSQRMAVKSDVEPLEVYRSLRVVNPSPFMFFVRTPKCTLVGCSPEIMCRVSEGLMTIRPLAGTRKRGATEAEDQQLERDLLADPKEKAEHVMLVDLGRNDVGRVAKFGSVELTEIMVIERYSHVMHISSEVRGQLRDGLDAFDALASSLPAGTVSGAPKVRAMQIIDELEPHRRGPYGGAVGYIDYRGNMDTCLALRTMVHVGDTYYVQAGCGVVADSDPTAEYEETINKAAAMVAAIRMTAARLKSAAVNR